MQRKLFSLVLPGVVLICLFLQTATGAFGAAIWTNAAGGAWSDGVNWNGGRAPNLSLGGVYLSNAVTKTVTLDGSTPLNNLSVNSLNIWGPPDSTNTLLLLNLGLNRALVVSNQTLTVADRGAIVVTDSSLVVTGRFISFNVWAGNVTLDSGSIVVRESPLTTNVTVVTRIGRTNAATLTINGGLMDVTKLLVGERPASQLSHGTIRMTGGLLQVASELSIGDGAGCTGVVAMVGGRLVVANNLTNIMRVGDYGFGQMTISNATAEIGNTSVARHDSSRGLLVLQDNALVIGSDDFNIGRFSGATGTVYVAGGQLIVTNNPISVGREGNGQLILSNGLVSTRTLNVAVIPTNTAQGLVTLAGGRTLVSSNFLLGNESISRGRVLIEGGELFVTNEASTACLTLSSGSFTINGGVAIVDHLLMTNAAGTLALNGGTLSSAGTVVSNGRPFVIGDGATPTRFTLRGGTHSFSDGLVISPQATLDGCGIIIGNIVNHGVNAVDCGASGAPPLITQPPASLTVTQGYAASLSVAATGTPAPAYQWRFGPDPGNDLPGATGSTLTLSDAQAADAGHYRVVVSNASGSVTSVVAILRVLLPPALATAQFSGGSFQVSSPSATGLNYVLESKERLDDPVWIPIVSAPGTGALLTLSDTAPWVPARFYRVRVE